MSVGIVDGELLVDLCYAEDSKADVDMNLVMTGDRPVRRGAGHRRGAALLGRSSSTDCTALAADAIAELTAMQRRVLADTAA